MGLFDIFRVGKIKAENEALKQKFTRFTCR